MKLSKIKLRYREHRGRVKRSVDKNGNPIEFKLTFDEWYSIWINSGHWEERGRSHGQYCMSRYNDIGHYEIDNVFIQLHAQNTSDGHYKVMSEEMKQKISATKKGKPSTFKGRKHSEESKRLISIARNKYLGEKHG